MIEVALEFAGPVQDDALRRERQVSQVNLQDVLTKRRAGVAFQGQDGHLVAVGLQECCFAPAIWTIAQNGDTTIDGLVGVADRAHSHTAVADGFRDALDRREPVNHAGRQEDRARMEGAARAIKGEYTPRDLVRPSARLAKIFAPNSTLCARSRFRSLSPLTPAGKPGVFWPVGIQLARDGPPSSTRTERPNSAR